MSQNQVSITNAALRIIAANTIADPAENTESARQARGCYAQVVRAELAAHPWIFALKQTQLALVDETPLYDFAYVYQLPSDCVRLVSLQNRWLFPWRKYAESDPIPFYSLMGDKLYTNLAAPMRVTYIRDMTDEPEEWSPAFCAVASAALAIQLANPLAKSDSACQRAEQQYQKELSRARRVNAIQLAPQYPPDGSWLTARIY
jgi:hypothetical protein